MIKMNETVINLLQIAEKLNGLAAGFSTIGNTYMQSVLNSLARGISREVEVIEKVADDDLKERVKLAHESSENVLNAAFAGIELASKGKTND